MDSWVRTKQDLGHRYFNVYSKIEIDDEAFEKEGGMTRLLQDEQMTDVWQADEVRKEDDFVIDALFQPGASTEEFPDRDGLPAAVLYGRVDSKMNGEPVSGEAGNDGTDEVPTGEAPPEG